MDETKEKQPSEPVMGTEATLDTHFEESASLHERPWLPQDADKESLRYAIRQRVRNTTAAPNAVITYPDPTPTIRDAGDKKVAVYARVSTKSTEQVSSIENQTKYYTEKVEQTPNWELQEIYSDEGKSGTSMKKRTEFKRMLKDAADKKMDIILCASVSRFARNVAICTEQLRLLRTQNPSHPVGVYFETENIYTLDPSSNQALTIHGMMAEWESAQKSSRMILSYDQRIFMGQYPLSDLLGYRHTTDGHLIIQEDEAITVRFVFLAYICGYSLSRIAEILTEKGRKTLKGRTEWDAAMVKAIMENERRWGDLDVRKRIVIDYVAGKTIKNEKTRVKAFIPGHHEGIVTPEIAKAAHCIFASTHGSLGMCELHVIENGSLKGFVSVSPTWGGMNADAIKQISRSAYTDDEFADLERESKILTGEEHSNVLSLQFTGYEVPHGVYFMNRNTSAMTLAPNRIHFNKASHVNLGAGQTVEILYHPFLQALVVRACESDSPNAFRWETETGDIIASVAARVFCGAIYEETHWMTEYKFRFRGTTRIRGNARMTMFFLDEPQILVGKNRVEKKETQPPVQFIPYKRTPDNKSQMLTEDEVSLAYPREWNNNAFGTSYSRRKMRDRIIDALTEEDISIHGTAALNPMIGSVPSKKELCEEVDRLLMSM
jgi:Site-specific recombinases, DNA invertase Pin homologs